MAGSGTFVRVYRNDGDKFTAGRPTRSASAHVPSGYSLNLVDYDNDGWLDLYISLNGWSGPMPNLLFHNEHGKFVERLETERRRRSRLGLRLRLGRPRQRRLVDLVVANGVLKDGSTPQIYRNNRNGTFTNVTKQAGFERAAGVRRDRHRARRLR